MKDNFDKSVSLVLKHEGGYVDHPSDPGGATNMGITRKTLANWRGVVPYTNLPKSEVKNLTVEEAKEIYKARYWDEVNGDLLPSGIDHVVHDYGINSGPQKAVMELQELVGVARDGVVGNKTLAAVAEKDLEALLISYMDERLKFLKRLSTWAVFGKGWKSRIDRVTKEGKDMLSSDGLSGGSVKDSTDTEGDKENDDKKNFSLLALLLSSFIAAIKWLITRRKS
jgi:lysozyme family protein